MHKKQFTRGRETLIHIRLPIWPRERKILEYRICCYFTVATCRVLLFGKSCLHGSIKWSPLIFETKLVLNQQSGAAHSDVLCIHCIHCLLESSHVIFLPAATYLGRCLFVVLFSALSLWDYVCNLFLTKESINCTQQIESSTGGLQESVQLYINIRIFKEFKMNEMCKNGNMTKKTTKNWVSAGRDLFARLDIKWFKCL